MNRLNAGIAAPGTQCRNAAAFLRYLQIGLLFAVAVLLLLFFASLNRPIWIDEFLQFAFGAYSSTKEAAKAIYISLDGLNHNQTGAYMILDYWLMSAFGASEFLLRLPSLFGGALLMAGAILFLKGRGFNFFWQLAIIPLMASEYNIIHFVGDARPYMPLAGAVIGVLAYYGTPPDRRVGFAVIIGWASAIYGALMHPYFGPYMAICGVIMFVDRRLRMPFRGVPLFADFLRFIDLPFVVAIASIYLMLSYATWFSHHPTLAYDPFQLIKYTDLVRVFMVTHIQFLPYGDSQYFALLIGLSVVTFALVSLRWHIWKVLVGPLLLLYAALAASIAISLSSYLNHYWILQRQWIASVAICTIAAVWYAAEFSKVAAEKRGNTRYAAMIVSVVLVGCLYRLTLHANQQWTRIQGWQVEQAQIKASLSLLPPDASATLKQYPLPLLDWVRLGTQNMAAGGPVWPVFKRFYSG